MTIFVSVLTKQSYEIFDPKADLTFKRVFGEHPDLVMSLLNALLPLNPGEEITSITFPSFLRNWFPRIHSVNTAL